MSFISQAELERRLGSNKNLANTLTRPASYHFQVPQVRVVDPVKETPLPATDATDTVASAKHDTATIHVVPPAKTPKARPAPSEARVLAAALVAQGEKAPDVAAAVGLTVSQVHSAVHSDNPALQAKTAATLDKVRELVLDRMVVALGLMNNGNMTDVSAKDLSIISSNLARVLDKTSAHETETRTQLIVYAPEQREEKTYRTIDVSAEKVR